MASVEHITVKEIFWPSTDCVGMRILWVSCLCQILSILIAIVAGVFWIGDAAVWWAIGCFAVFGVFGLFFASFVCWPNLRSNGKSEDGSDQSNGGVRRYCRRCTQRPNDRKGSQQDVHFHGSGRKVGFQFDGSPEVECDDDYAKSQECDCKPTGFSHYQPLSK